MTLAVAHRGDPYRHRENTLASVLSAARVGADAVEVDVRITEDGVPVLLHDRTLRRLWGVDRPVATTPSAETARLGIPTLRDALDGLGKLPGDARPRLLIDLMDTDSARAAVVEVGESGARERVYYCGGPTPMLAVRRGDSAAEIALTWRRAAPPPASLMKMIRPRWLNFPFGMVDPALVQRVHADGLLVGVWTVDTPWNMGRLIRSGVDAITSNRISVLRRLLARAR